eukprot:Blabericola_migrator_1__6479@NODE_326_length_9761_cov_41_862080_g263_i0_p4_GENE_NODE_326_length_9761_cov_41_862080_g263_i0NODE_326_length_9761_cov_41_862080_g263_i0_p4_ORF_typecomplete_len193_score23_70DnaI_N/PF07319_11/0_15DUF568/PF04526_13/0_27_NODE_326_length_9761_cov_41_862080_g263_i039784556
MFSLQLILQNECERHTSELETTEQIMQLVDDLWHTGPERLRIKHRQWRVPQWFMPKTSKLNDLSTTQQVKAAALISRLLAVEGDPSDDDLMRDLITLKEYCNEHSNSITCADSDSYIVFATVTLRYNYRAKALNLLWRKQWAPLIGPLAPSVHIHSAVHKKNSPTCSSTLAPPITSERGAGLSPNRVSTNKK